MLLLPYGARPYRLELVPTHVLEPAPLPPPPPIAVPRASQLIFE